MLFPVASPFQVEVSMVEQSSAIVLLKQALKQVYELVSLLNSVKNDSWLRSLTQLLMFLYSL